jgi:hypothetical protein
MTNPCELAAAHGAEVHQPKANDAGHPSTAYSGVVARRFGRIRARAVERWPREVHVRHGYAHDRERARGR